jgi:hypothetical protein
MPSTELLMLSCADGRESQAGFEPDHVVAPRGPYTAWETVNPFASPPPSNAQFVLPRFFDPETFHQLIERRAADIQLPGCRRDFPRVLSQGTFDHLPLQRFACLLQT